MCMVDRKVKPEYTVLQQVETMWDREEVKLKDHKKSWNALHDTNFCNEANSWLPGTE